MSRGLVIGKFWPPHKGHSYLIHTALTQVDHLTVIVCEKADQDISGAQRAKWLKELHPQAEVRVIEDNLDPDDSQAWAKHTIEQLGYVPDVVFTSEDYGDPYAQYMGCRHVLVDKKRAIVPCSARFIRENPLQYWEFLEPCVRVYFLKRICILGAESTGKTTLAQLLAQKYQTVWVPEYGRIYAEGKAKLPSYSIWESSEFTHIAQSQAILENQLAPHADRYLICDTDPFATKIWHRRYMGFFSDEVAKIAEQQRYDLYLIPTPDVSFVQDGTRDGEHLRGWMHELFLNALLHQKVPFLVLYGSYAERFEQAVNEIDHLPSQKQHYTQK
jgi:HTH-type transcriptional repressor of NAD biosynthesis genes